MRPAGADRRTPGLRPFHDCTAAFLSGSDSPRAYLERCLDTLEALERQVRAFVAYDVSTARAAADASTARYESGQPLSSIDGMPIGIKDLFETSDFPTQMGSPIFAGWRTQRDAAAVYALRRGGAVILGKTVTTEFGFYAPGPTRNPFDLGRTPGGSSSGSAAAVGAGMVAAAIGSQVVGSLIRPASYCGNFGYKPTLGALNRQGGHSGLSQSCLGVHAASLADLWNVSAQIAREVGGDPGYPGLIGPQEIAPPTPPARLIKLETPAWTSANDRVRAQLDEAATKLARAGVEIVSRAEDHRVEEFEVALGQAHTLTNVICGYELRWPLRHYRERHPELLSRDLDGRLKSWEKLTAEDYRAALAARDSLRQQHAALGDIAPAAVALAATGAAPAGLSATGDPMPALVSSVLGAPAMTLPVLEADGLPLGLQVIGFMHADWKLAGIAGWIVNTLGEP